MPDIDWIPPTVGSDGAATRLQFVEFYGSTVVMNTFLKIVVLCLSATVIALAALNIKTYAAFHHLQPLVIRINEVGRAEAVNYGSFDYHPQEVELKYFLVQFVQGYYGRVRATLKESYPRSLFFLDGRLADAVMSANKKTKIIETFLTSQIEEVDVQVRNVSIEDLRQAPYKATVEYDKVYYGGDHLETHRQRFVANFVFVVKQPVPNELIPVNPLGLTITYFHEDQAFQ